MRTYASPVATSAPVASAVAEDAHHPRTLRAEARAAGVSPATVHRRRKAEAAQEVAEKALLAARTQRASKPKVAPLPKPSAAVPDVAAALAALASAMQQQSVLLGSLLTAREPIRVPEPIAAADAVAEKPRVRVQAAPASVPPTARDTEYVGPLGDGRPYSGEIFGTTVRRRPVVAATMSVRPRLTLAIGDSHYHPAIEPLTVRAMTLAALHAVARKPEFVVHIGDGGDWSSACRHVRNDTWKARTKPSIRQDLDCFRANWDALNAPLDEAGIAIGGRNYCWGNHDAWLHSLEDDHPEMKGLATGELSGILRGAGWSETDYGEYYWIGGVGYTHVPLNLMGRPAGGQTAENTIAMQSTRDTVLGHTHRYAVGRRIKMDGTTVTALNTGSSMPPFYVGEYAQLGQGKSLDYGVLEVIDFDGRIQSHRFVSMRELEALYGTDADRRLS